MKQKLSSNSKNNSDRQDLLHNLKKALELEQTVMKAARDAILHEMEKRGIIIISTGRLQGRLGLPKPTVGPSFDLPGGEECVSTLSEITCCGDHHWKNAYFLCCCGDDSTETPQLPNLTVGDMEGILRYFYEVIDRFDKGELTLEDLAPADDETE